MKSIRATIEFKVQVPDSVTEDDIAAMTFEIPVEAIAAYDGDGNVIQGAKVASYTTEETVEE